MRAGLLLPALLGMVACAEMRTPAPPVAPAGLAGSTQPGGQVDPLRAAILATATAFADAGLSLAEKPAEMAQAAAQLEYLATALPRSQAYAAMPAATRRSLELARAEVRGALGINDTAETPAVTAALLAAARALREGQPQQAAAALPAGMFRPGGAASLRRFAEPGPLPQAAAATALARQDLARMDGNQQWLQGRPQDMIDMETGATPTGRGPGETARF